MNFSAFDKSTIEQYQKEAKERFGKTDAWKESQEKTKGRSKEEWNLVLGEMQELLKRISALVGTDPAGEEAQQLVEEWRQHITKNYYTCTPEILQGLGQMYCADERFLANIDRYQVGTAQFLQKQLKFIAKTDDFLASIQFDNHLTRKSLLNRVIPFIIEEEDSRRNKISLITI